MAYDQWDNALNSYQGAQLYANGLQAQNNFLYHGQYPLCPNPREMAAEDLGLYWDGEWRHLPVKHTDAPYSFWLGANA